MNISGPRVPIALQRAADLDRSAVCDELCAHFAAGRLGEDELDARLGAAVSAPTVLELRHLVADLPALPPVSPPAGAGRGRWSALDVLALLTVLGSLGFAFFMLLVLAVGGAGGAIVAGLLGGSVAAAGGAGAAHLAHRGWQRGRLPAGEPQRPRIA